MDLQGINTGAELLTETTEIAELSIWQKIARIEPTPDMVRDMVMYLLVMVLLCVLAKIVYDWKESRRLKKEFAEYMQRKAEEE